MFAIGIRFTGYNVSSIVEGKSMAQSSDGCFYLSARLPRTNKSPRWGLTQRGEEPTLFKGVVEATEMLQDALACLTKYESHGEELRAALREIIEEIPQGVNYWTMLELVKFQPIVLDTFEFSL